MTECSRAELENLFKKFRKFAIWLGQRTAHKCGVNSVDGRACSLHGLWAALCKVGTAANLAYISSYVRGYIYRWARLARFVKVPCHLPLSVDRTKVQVLVEDTDADFRKTGKVLYSQEEIVDLRMFMNRLTMRQRTFLKLRYYQGLTWDEIGEKADLSRERVRQIAMKGLRRLQFYFARTDRVAEIKAVAAWMQTRTARELLHRARKERGDAGT